ncbi:MAG: putative DNA binding domain-containing protein [Sediminibacterium sp.]|uniref:RNA-binding domain-containing protein n=1 Tax=Sediminibacterium sp. TaxID=1917865 RepID=UPI00271F7A88|nr:RNA-binding domain-containing protein [Sediminibacterium sp.]MDO8996505.1 putative DNA binding domain-containing protein [Sediminibacterium sp.]
MTLHINIEDLLSARTVESDRIEFKEGWNPDAIYRSICAFANDFDNISGGYILVGVAEDEKTKTAKRPVKGLTTSELSEIQQKMIGFNNLLQPTYHPHLFIEDVDGKQILILWIPGGSNRPYQVPEQITAKEKRYFYYVRKYANSVKAGAEEQQELISLANQIPFDDRSNTQAKVSDISMVLVKNYLSKINSRLADQVGKISDKELLAQMELISGPNEHVFPRNVGLMMFADNPELFFPCTRVEIIDFPDGDAGDFEEQDPISGPIPEQINRVLKFLKDKLVKEKVIKPIDKAESTRIASYPYQAIEEILVNAFYHRDYHLREPIEIRIYPNSIVFINHGGPDRSIHLGSFNSGQVRNRRYRNRRLGEFLKELQLTEGRATGIPTILKALKDNGSPAPSFKSDDDRSYFEVEINIHPSFEQIEQIDINQVAIELKGIDNKVSQFVAFAPARVRDKVRDIAGDIAGDVAAKVIKDKIAKNDSAVAGDIVRAIDRDSVVDIAIDVQEFINDKFAKILNYCQKPKQRKDILKEIGLVNNVKNYDTYVAPLVQMGWVRMTIPDKPTSPKQQYRTTLKGIIISELLNYIDDGE